MAAFSIRLARTADARLIAAMSRDLIETGLGWSWTPQRVVRSIRDRESNVIVAERDGRVIGFGLMKYLEEEAHLLLFAVMPSARRNGVGSALLRWLVDTALVAGIGTIDLEVRARNAAGRAFYRRAGFAEQEVIDGYYRGVEAAIRMRRRLWSTFDSRTA